MDERDVILIVDDEKMNLLQLSKILSPTYAVCLAKTGKDALRIAEELRPSLILLDILMPDEDGFETLRALKENPETKEIFVIMISGLVSNEHQEKGLSLGAVDYITKPYENSLVLARVNAQIKVVRALNSTEMKAKIDPLTEVGNRRMFEERLEHEWKQALRTGECISFIMMDLDNFKKYNDTYGHPQGDVLLKSVAKLIKRHCRRPSDLPVRMGGEEFGVLLPCTNLEGSLSVAERMRANIEREEVPLQTGELTKITMSFGVCTVYPMLGDSSEELISKADKCLYAAKDSGRNAVFSEYGPCAKSESVDRE